MANLITTTVKVEGLKELVEKLKVELPEKVKKETRAALKEGGVLMQEAMEAELVTHRKSGRLEDDINIRVSMKKFDEGLEAVFIGPDGRDVYPQVLGQKISGRGKTKGMLVDFRRRVATVARYLEFGTSRSHGAHPFMQPAFAKKKDAAYEAIKDHLRRALGIK